MHHGRSAEGGCRLVSELNVPCRLQSTRHAWARAPQVKVELVQAELHEATLRTRRGPTAASRVSCRPNPGISRDGSPAAWPDRWSSREKSRLCCAAHTGGTTRPPYDWH